MYQSKKVLLLGSGELGKEVVIEAQRLGVETVAVDSYEHAPAMQVAHKSYVVDMLNREQIREVIEKEKPDLIVPEVEAIATDELLKLEAEGFRVIRQSLRWIGKASEDWRLKPWVCQRPAMSLRIHMKNSLKRQVRSAFPVL